jgi:endoglucanase
MDLKTHLKALCAAPGISGHEHGVHDVIAAAWKPLTDELHTDRMGSLWAIKRGSGPEPRPKLMIAAHMDAIGLMVSHVAGEFLRVTAVGGIDARVMPGQPVTVYGRIPLPGVVVQPPGFLLPKAIRDGVVPVSELLIDCGLPAEALADQVRVGDVIALAQPPIDLRGGLLVANRLDNRASVAAVTEALLTLQHRDHRWDVVAVATVQEEVGLKGALTSAFALDPQLALVLDVTFGAGPAAREFNDKVFELGKGPTVTFGPNLHPVVHQHLIDCAERDGITIQIEPSLAGSGTDAFAIQIAREGIPCGLIGLPLRNMHTPVEVVAVRDVAAAGKLVAQFILWLTPDYLKRITYGL